MNVLEKNPVAVLNVPIFCVTLEKPPLINEVIVVGAVVESVPFNSGIEIDDALSKNKIQPEDAPGVPGAPAGPVGPP